MKEFAISKEDFSYYIRFIEERYNKVREINKLILDEFEDSILYPYSKYETALVKLLKRITHDNCDWIGHYLYECDFGRKPDLPTRPDGSEIPFNSPEDLYDLLLEDYNEEEQAHVVELADTLDLESSGE